MARSKKIKKVNFVEQIIEFIQKGENLETIKAILEDKLNEDDDFDDLYLKALQELADRLKKKPAEIIYAEYFCDMMQINRQLDVYINNLDKAKNVKEGSFALKAKIDLLRDLHINAREKLGLLGKTDNSNGLGSFIGNVNISVIQNMTNEEKKKAMLEFADDFKRLVNKVEESGKLKKLVDVDPGPIHYGPSANDVDSSEEDSDEENSETDG